jgi:glycosyltransferase involved in cell wall biosynthesis
MSRAPTFSILTAAFQAAATIAESVASALGQTVPALEIVVCDDGSTDDIVGALAPFRDRITLIRKANGGAPSAMNAALRAASGDFVAVLDADDVYLPERIEALAGLARSRPELDVLTTDAYFEVDGRLTGRFNAANEFAVRDQRTAILDRCFIAWPAVRRDRLLEIGGFDERLRIGYDWDAWLRLLFSGSAAGHVDQPLMVYRLREGSLTSDRSGALIDRVTLLEKARREQQLSPPERAALERSLRGHRRRALVAAAEASLSRSLPDARRRSLAVALAPGVAWRTRLKGATAAAAPSLARRRLVRRAQA